MLEELQNKLFNEIPLTKLMNIKIQSYDSKELITTAPLDININDKGTAFGGSLSTLTIISSWSLCYLLAKELKLDKNNIMIIKNDTSFKAPVTKDLICHTYKPSIEDVEFLKNKLIEKRSGSIKISSQVIEDSRICVDFTGYYIIKLID